MQFAPIRLNVTQLGKNNNCHFATNERKCSKQIGQNCANYMPFKLFLMSEKSLYDLCWFIEKLILYSIIDL